MRSSTSEEISLLMWRVYSMVTYQVTAVDKSYQMRGIGNFYVADSKIAWQQVVGHGPQRFGGRRKLVGTKDQSRIIWSFAASYLATLAAGW